MTVTTKTRAQIKRELEPGLNRIIGKYRDVPSEWESLFEKSTSNRSFEEMLMTYGFGVAPNKMEGEGISYDSDGESYTVRAVHETVALGFAITEEAMEDNMYAQNAKRSAANLGSAFRRTKEIKAHALFNNGFSSYKTGDGVALFSASHPVYGGNTQSNLLTAADISETALQDAYTAIYQMQDERGNFIGASTNTLHIHPNDLFRVRKILESELTTIPLKNVAGTENVSNSNEKNIVASMNMFPGGIKVHRYFTDNDAYFIQTDVQDGGIYFQRRAFNSKMDEDFNTGNLLTKASERYSFVIADWRKFQGSQGG